jgi:hypothetical protein
MRGCVELRRVRRDLRLRRMLPGLACMGGLFGVSVPLNLPVYDLDAEWSDFTARVATKVEDPAS